MEQPRGGTVVRAEDGELVRQALAGERGAFTELVNRYRNIVCGVAYHYLGNFEDAQDAAQETFVHAFLHLKELREPEKFAPWLRRTATNLCADLRRRGSRLYMFAGDAGPPLTAIEDLAGAVHDGQLERLTTRMVVQEALSHLPEKARLTVTLFYISGYSHAEIARFLEIPVNTVRSRLQHAKRRLREEMIPMLTDTLNEARPDPDFTRRAVEEALRRGEEAWRSHEQGEAIRHYDQALGAVEKLEPGQEQQRLKMEALWKKGQASRFPLGREVAIALFEESLALAEQLGDREGQAARLVTLGSSVKDPERAEAHYQRALELYRQLGDARGQGECLLWLGSQRFFAREAGPGKRYYEQALPLLEDTHSHDYAAMCRAMLDLLAELGEEKFPELIAWSACCDTLAKKGDEVRTAGQPGIMMSPGRAEWANFPAPLRERAVFSQVSHLRKFLDRSVPVGGGWSGDAFSFSYQPLHAAVTVKSCSERVTVPAGTFSDCLLTAQVTKESERPDDAPEGARQLNRLANCGTRRAWYAPGVGLVQLHVETGEGTQALLQLQEYAAPDGGDAYLPLAVGNT
jgi:RNA polymerase sigma-70 factor, ECF subfamily